MIMLKTLRRGVAQLLDHPQLWLTIVVAVSIVGAFVYTSNRFIDIAKSAQDRLVNVRIGSLQDAFAPLAGAFIGEPEKLREYMRVISAQNPTIVDFDIVVEDAGRWKIALSLDPSYDGTSLVGEDLFLSLAKADPANSFTVEEVMEGERFFKTARAIQNASSSVIGVAITRQTLSEADRSIAASIRSSMYVLFGILALLMVLFFHHARIVDYTALYRRLKEVDQLKDDLISMVSHEFRTPLTVIRGYISEMRSGKGTMPQNEMLSRIERSAETLNMLVTDTLDVARIEQGRMQFRLADISPATVITEVCETLKPSAVSKGLSLTWNVDTGVQIHADPDRLRQVITNLVSNAIKYSDQGEILVQATKINQDCVMRVSDKGIGMTSEEQAQLFGKFSRATGERVRKEVGTGLGLWITKQLVEEMGGRISVESIKGVGSHFIVTFKLARSG
jgi:signal transduction histidine kinase